MRSSALFVAVCATVIATATPRPLWSTLINHEHPEISAQPHYLATSPYYFYNLHANAAGLPSAILTNGEPEVPPHAFGFYYGTPMIYDFGFPLNPVYPEWLTPSRPGLPGRPALAPTTTTTTTTRKPFDEEDNYDSIEKLDSKVEPNAETKEPENNERDDDSISVEAIRDERARAHERNDNL